MKNQFFRKNKIEKPLIQLTKKGKKAQFNNISVEKKMLIQTSHK